MTGDLRARARELARGGGTDWFEQLYREAGDRVVPWADLQPHPMLVGWWDARPAPIEAGRVAVVGCGYGDDAAFLAEGGATRVTAFDVSQSVVAAAAARFPDHTVEWRVADATSPPTEWAGAFDLVVEINTLQVLGDQLRQAAATGIAGLVAPGGLLLVVARWRDPSEDRGQLPWPLCRDDLDPFEAGGLTVVSLDDGFDGEDPPVRRVVVTLRRG